MVCHQSRQTFDGNEELKTVSGEQTKWQPHVCSYAWTGKAETHKDTLSTVKTRIYRLFLPVEQQNLAEAS